MLFVGQILLRLSHRNPKIIFLINELVLTLWCDNDIAAGAQIRQWQVTGHVRAFVSSLTTYGSRFKSCLLAVVNNRRGKHANLK